MDEINQIAHELGIAVVEDAAQAIGATYPLNGKDCVAGSMGAAGCLSFFPSKNLGGLGDGGMVVTNDDALADKIRMLRNHGANPKYYHAMIGGNFRLDAIQAAVLAVKLNYLDEWHQQRRNNAEYYDDHFTAEAITTPAAPWGRERHVYNQYVISVPDRRDELREHFRNNEIGTDEFYA